MSVLMALVFFGWPAPLGAAVGLAAWLLAGPRAGIGWGVGTAVVTGALWYWFLRNNFTVS